MPVVTIKNKVRSHPTPSLMEKVQQKTEHLLDAADRVLVVYAPTGASLYYENGTRLKTGSN